MFFRDLYREKPHYEFVPLVLASAVWFFWSRWPDCPFVWGRAERFLCFGLLGLSLAGLTAATLLVSPWLGMVSFLLAVASWGIWSVGKLGIASLLPPWLLLWVIVPPPLQLDVRAITMLQTSTSRCTAMLLDWMRIPYLRQGNVFEIENRSLFVAEACSGVHSQLVLIAVSAILCIVLRRSAAHALMLIASAAVWSIIINIIRVFVVVVAESRGVSASEGWVHEALGYGVVLLGLLLVYSTDQLIFFLISPIDAEWADEHLSPANVADGPSADQDKFELEIDSRFWRVWNRLTTFPSTPVVEGRESDLRPRSRSLVPFAVAFALLVLPGLLPLRSASANTGSADASALYARLKEEVLPETIEGFRRTKHLKEERDPSSSEGMYSHQWQYVSPTEIIGYAMDFPFYGWHELTICYYLKGWDVSSLTDLQDSDGDPYVEAILKRGLNEWGVLHFSLYGSDKRSLRHDHSTYDYFAKARLLDRIDNSPIVRWLRDQALVPINLPSYQFQQFTRKPVEPTDDEREQLRSLYLSAKRLWLNSNAFE